jgi:hypothetical protein
MAQGMTINTTQKDMLSRHQETHCVNRYSQLHNAWADWGCRLWPLHQLRELQCQSWCADVLTAISTLSFDSNATILPPSFSCFSLRNQQLSPATA